MKIIAKSAPYFNELNDKKNKGAEYVEIQLLKNNIMGLEENHVNIIESELNVLGVHPPMGIENNIESLACGKNIDEISYCYVLADYISKSLNHRVYVVCHCELSLDQLNKWGMFDNIITRFDKILNKYPNIDINLENTMKLDPKKDSYRFRNAYFEEPFYICEELRKRLKTDRIGLVLDTCHALANIEAQNSFYGVQLGKKETIEDYFNLYKPYLKVIHLANSRNYGFGSDILEENGHGVGFYTDEEIDVLKNLINNIQRIEFNDNLVLEIAEENYLDSIEFADRKSVV